MANISGKVTAITVLAPMRPWKRLILQVLFRLVSWGFYSYIQQKLVKLSFIHFVNWSVIRRSDFPHLDPDQPIDRPRYDYGSHNSAKQQDHRELQEKLDRALHVAHQLFPRMRYHLR